MLEIQKCFMINIVLIGGVKDSDVAVCIRIYLLQRNELQMAIFALLTVIPSRQPYSHLLRFYYYLVKILRLR